MAYRESRRYCKICGRKTLHWRPGSDWREAAPAEGLQALIRAIWKLIQSFQSRQWRCIDCDHPWNTSLLREQELHGREKPSHPPSKP